MKLPSEMTYWERVRFTILCLIALLSLLGFIHITETMAPVSYTHLRAHET